ncbi:uncharacterized protein [Henckelia pumila]|uniref:uncharacterized protein n=1 Tax=Henckelia pumila TaxID=405737 RepID=UPI003C6E86A3
MDIDTARLEIVLVDPKVVVSDVVTTREAQFHVDIEFSCDLVMCECYDNVSLGHIVRPRFMTKSVRMDIKQLMDPEYSHRMIARELGEWPLDDRNRCKLSKFAFKIAKDLMRFMPPQHNVLVIPFCVSVECNRHVDENIAMEWMDVNPMLEEEPADFDEVFPASDSADFQMVPASDSSVDEYLNIKTTTCEDEEESCSICLEDFYAGCQVLSMPCSHIFHQDCIKKWLKSSHYCPMCRFQMPC